MAQTPKDLLKRYFETGDKPSQAEYAELIDALRHMDDKILIDEVESLQSSLDSKATTSALLSHINDSSVHGASTMTGSEIKTAYEAEADTNAFTDAEKQQVANGLTHRAATDIHVTTVDKTNWNGKLNAGAYVGSAQDLKDEIDIKISANNSGDSLKVFNELGQAVFPPQLKYNSVLVDSINGNDATGQLENYSNPFQTIQAAMNAYRESASYDHNNFLTVEFATAGDYTFEYLSAHNVIFKSNLVVNIKAVSTGENFTANGLDSGHVHYTTHKGSLILELPAGTFENRYIDDGTFTRQPNFNLDHLIVRSLKKLIVYNKTRLQYNYTGYSKPIPFTINNFCDLGQVDVDTNMSFIFLASTAKKSNINFGDVLIHKQDEAVEDAATGIVNPIVLVNSQVDISFSYTSINVEATSQSTTIMHATGDMTAPIQFGNVTNDSTNSDCVLLVGSSGSREFTLQFNNSTLQNCLITQSPNVRFTGNIVSTTSTKITETGGSWIQNWTFDNFSGDFNSLDSSAPTLLYLYQIGSNTNNAVQTVSLQFINTIIKSGGNILIVRDISPTTTYPALNFLGSNILSCKTGEIINGYINGNVRMFKTGKLITNKALPSNVSIIPISDSGYYQEIT